MLVLLRLTSYLKPVCLTALHCGHGKGITVKEFRHTKVKKQLIIFDSNFAFLKFHFGLVDILFC